ncbi:FBD-associated F-box protein At5g22730-like [Lolium rigidum]|uniref:FBD-associated F-box protein At5g22730-like n=1 Tax=Lolium rigidum TaxID=89674 RepID=UPI001F5DDB41|nr:FBD-associated F-box protein At5g22730-like [Lolium rigidum]
MREGLRPRRQRPLPAIGKPRGPRTSKKRKVSLPQPAATPGAPDLPNPRSTERPPAAGADEDRISLLDDDNLRHIVSLLPIKDGARTQALASRWRTLWRTAPLNLDYREFPTISPRIRIISDILSFHPGPGRRFRVDPFYLHVPEATVDAWLRSAALDNLQELYIGSLTEIEPLPASAFRFSATLLVATFRHCTLPDDIVQGLHFPLLKQLGLETVTISELALHNLIAANAPALECLLINKCVGLRRVRIISLSLTSIGVRPEQYNPLFEELVIENAPCLQRLLHLEFAAGIRVTVLSAPKLETLGCLSDVTLPTLGEVISGITREFCNPDQDRLPKFVFGSTVIQGSRVDKLTTAVRTVKILAVRMGILSLDRVIELMSVFPSLEKLYIQAESEGENNACHPKHKNFIRRFDIRVKTIALECYEGHKSEVDFAKFFVLNAKALELMTFHIHPDLNREEFFSKQTRELQLEKKASKAAQFEFRFTRCVRNVETIHHVHDLDLTDPFTC